MRTLTFLAAFGLAGALVLPAGPATAHSSVSFSFHAGPGHHHPRGGHVHYHGGRACTARHGYYDGPSYYGPRVHYGPYLPPPPPVFRDDCGWYRGRWHCY